MAGYLTNIDKATLDNIRFRQVLFTVMSENTIARVAEDRAAIERWEDEGGKPLTMVVDSVQRLDGGRTSQVDEQARFTGGAHGQATPGV